MDYQRSITVDLPHTEAVTRTRQALAEQGFGILTERQILDPQIMASITNLPALAPIADEASTRLQAVLENLSGR